MSKPLYLLLLSLSLTACQTAPTTTSVAPFQLQAESSWSDRDGSIIDPRGVNPNNLDSITLDGAIEALPTSYPRLTTGVWTVAGRHVWVQSDTQIDIGSVSPGDQIRVRGLKVTSTFIIALQLTPPPVGSFSWQPFVGSLTPPDPLNDRLCLEGENPVNDEKYTITCRLEGANFALNTTPPPTDEVVVMTYNMERNFQLDQQIQTFLTAGDRLPIPDILLASEVDRGCGRSGQRNGGYEFAQALGLNYVFGVEFVELPRSSMSTLCEHGQAIFSRYPIGNVTLFRHPASGNDEFDDPNEPRLGTRVDLEADIRIGDRYLHVVSVHYDDRPSEQPARTEQAIGTATNALAYPKQVIVGGDMNTAFYFLDPTPRASTSEAARVFWQRGFYDTHNGLRPRITVPFDLGGITFPAVVDLLWVTDLASIKDPRGCDVDLCGDLSDHLPQWVTLELD